MQVCPRPSQTTPAHDADEQVAQLGPGPPPDVKVAKVSPERPDASTARMVAVPTQLLSFDSLQETRVTLAGVPDTWVAFCPFMKVPRFVETQIAPLAAPLTRTETAFVPFATTEAGLTETARAPEVGPLGGGVELEVQAESAATERTARARIRRSMETSSGDAANTGRAIQGQTDDSMDHLPPTTEVKEPIAEFHLLAPGRGMSDIPVPEVENA